VKLLLCPKAAPLLNTIVKRKNKNFPI